MEFDKIQIVSRYQNIYFSTYDCHYLMRRKKIALNINSRMELMEFML